LSDVCVLAEISLWSESELFGPFFSHDQAGGGPVRQEGGVGSGHSAMGLDEGRLQFSQLQ